MNILALCGSLRAASINRMLLHAAARLAPNDVRVGIYEHMHALPLFNPDLEARMPASVQALRDAVIAADALLIASPEYAHGLSSVLKTALDWMVSDERFTGKVVAVLNSSPYSQHADAQLREVLQTMSSTLIESASIAVQIRGTSLAEDAIVQHATIADTLRAALRDVQHAVLAQRAATADKS